MIRYILKRHSELLLSWILFPCLGFLVVKLLCVFKTPGFYPVPREGIEIVAMLFGLLLALFFIGILLYVIVESLAEIQHEKQVDKAVKNFLDEYERTQGHRPVVVGSRLPKEERYEYTIKKLEEQRDFAGAKVYRKMLRDMKAGKKSPWSDGKW